MRKYPILLAVLFAFIAITYYFDSFSNLGKYKSVTQDNISYENSLINDLNSEITLEQKIILENSNEISGLSLKFATYNRVNLGELNVKIYSDNKVFYDDTIPLSSLLDNDFYYFDFQENYKNQNNDGLYIRLKTNANSGASVALYASSKTNDTNVLKLNDEFYDADMEYKLFSEKNLSILSYIYIGLALFYSCLIYFLSKMLLSKKISIGNFVFITILSVGFLSILIFTPNSVPDEGYHIKAAYHAASEIVNLFRPGQFTRIGDFKFDLSMGTTVTKYISNFENFKLFMPNEMKSFVSSNISNTPNFELIHLIQYFPQIITILISFLMGFSFEFMIYLSKFTSLIFYALIIRQAIKIFPGNKMPIAVISMLPMSLHLAGSFSYDSMIIALGIFFVAYILKLRTDSNYLTKQEIVALFALNILFLPHKVFVYFPMIFLNLLILDKFHNRKDLIRFLVTLLISVSLSIIILNYTFFLKIFTSIFNSVSLGYNGNAYTVSNVIGNPLKLIEVFFNTVIIKHRYYIDSLIGYSLSWFDTPINSIYISIFVSLILFSTFITIDETNSESKLYYYTLLSTFILSFSLILLSMFFLWTPAGLPYIEGVQGRYFLPMILPLLVFFRGLKITISKNKELLFYSFVYLLSCLVFFDAINFII